MPGTDPGPAQGQPIPQTDVILCALQRQTHTKSADACCKLNLQASVYFFLYYFFFLSDHGSIVLKIKRNMYEPKNERSMSSTCPELLKGRAVCLVSPAKVVGVSAFEFLTLITTADRSRSVLTRAK